MWLLGFELGTFGRAVSATDILSSTKDELEEAAASRELRQLKCSRHLSCHLYLCLHLNSVMKVSDGCHFDMGKMILD